MNKFLVFLCAMSLVFGVVGIANANLIENGSFEDPVTGDPWWAHLTSIDGWSYDTGPGVEYQAVGVYPLWSAADGNQWVELASDVSYTLSQEFATISGQTYMVKFAFSPRPTRPIGDMVLQYGAGSSLFGFEYFDDTRSASGVGLEAMGWEYYSFYFTASSTFSCISFTDAGSSNDGYGPLLDDVSVNPVPEPATMLLLGSGLIGLAAFGRRRFFKKS